MRCGEAGAGMKGNGMEKHASVATLRPEAGTSAAAHEVLHPTGWPRPRGYSNGILAEGRIVVTGGVVGWTVAGHFPESFVAQARQTFENIAAILAEAAPAGASRPLTWYVTDMDEYLASPRDLGTAYRASSAGTSGNGGRAGGAIGRAGGETRDRGDCGSSAIMGSLRAEEDVNISM